MDTELQVEPDSLRAWIDQKLRIIGRSPSWLCVKAGYAKSNLSNWEDPDKKPRIDLVLKTCAVLAYGFEMRDRDVRKKKELEYQAEVMALLVGLWMKCGDKKFDWNRYD